ncbi:hypothetical protein [Prevotella dentasini]|uniref:hypothetical protein n=1 Tax=Prevotella dentasini TaxID=589537 RepID=UPI00046AAADC|nr:hypothetical protein [Prevotella dentasini]
MQIDEIEKLVQKYLDGNTTVAEEEQLRFFFTQDHLLLPDKLKPMCALFRWEKQECSGKTVEKTVQPAAMPTQTRKRPPHWLMAVISAAAVLTILILAVRRGAIGSNDYAVLNGERTTDREIVQREAEAALEMVSTDGSEDFSALSLIGGTGNEK